MFEIKIGAPTESVKPSTIVFVENLIEMEEAYQEKPIAPEALADIIREIAQYSDRWMEGEVEPEVRRDAMALYYYLRSKALSK